MLKYTIHPYDRKCVMSGATTKLSRAWLIPDEVADEGEDKVAVNEWMFGLPRGVLPSYLTSPANGMVLCPGTNVQDVSGYDEIHRGNQEAQAKRQITSPKAAHALQKQFKLQAQTDENLNGGIHPLDGNPLVPGSDRYPVLECYAHPFSISAYADKAFSMRRRKPLTDRWYALTHQWYALTHQWYALTRWILAQWEQKLIKPPQWFIDEPKLGEDDSELSATEAMGYCVTPLTIAGIDGDNNDERYWTKVEHYWTKVEHHWTKVNLWVNNVDPDAPDPNAPLPAVTEDPSITLLRSGAPHSVRSPPPRPVWVGEMRRPAWAQRNAPAWAKCDPPAWAKRDPPAWAKCDPPAWAKRDGQYPTPTFSSNDWAYFCHRITLNGATVSL
ncbi:hypothetical protein BD626DRAFT_599308 [Schizophyllum amplum]|uniref:Uncharacterized protein n=1 Tax=Schizophyllum amplum TaxID=97359 RepID=A0A550C965_9AGAR|nr:hypothetical protein BD626DRAFT_599308 [Auriculariopsis ampla]